MLKLFLVVTFSAAVLSAHAQPATNPFAKAPVARPSAPAPAAPVAVPAAPPGPVVVPPPPGDPGVAMPPVVPPPPPMPVDTPGASGPGMPSLPGLLGLKKDGPEEEEIRAVRIGTVNGKHIYRGERAYMFESEKDRPVTRRVVVPAEPGTSVAAPPSDAPVTAERRPDLPSAVGRPNPR